MKKVSTAAAKQSEEFFSTEADDRLDLGDRCSWYCVLDEAGEVLLEQKLGTTPKAMKEVFGAHAALPHRAGDGNAFALGQPVC